MMTNISLINHSTVLPDAAVVPIAAALQVQVARDFCPVWGMEPAKVLTGTAPPGAWQLVLLDDTDQANDLGYHELTSDGQPLGRVFVRSIQEYGLPLSIIISHELLEMLGNPEVDQFVALPDGTRVMREVCDPVESYDHPYAIEGVLVSNFTLPQYWNGSAAPCCDHLGLLTSPAPAMLTGGYMTVQDGSGLHAVYPAEAPAYALRPRHRTMLRGMPREEWRRSTA